MEKLIELLNQREREVNGNQTPGWSKEHLEYQVHGPRIISKKFGFIQWLVENDKIDLEKERNEEFKRIDFDLAEGMDGYEITTEDAILMWLSIQDNPIEFLVSILK